MIHFRSSSRISPDPILPGLFLPCSLPRLLSAAAGGGLEPSPVRRFRGASPHQLLSYAKEPSVAASFAHGTLKISLCRDGDGAALDRRGPQHELYGQFRFDAVFGLEAGFQDAVDDGSRSVRRAGQGRRHESGSGAGGGHHAHASHCHFGQRVRCASAGCAHRSSDSMERPPCTEWNQCIC